MIALGAEHLGGPVRLQVGADEVISGTLVGLRHRLGEHGEKRTTLDVEMGGEVVTFVLPPTPPQTGDTP